MMNPMVTVTKIDPTEIPEVSNKFLMRGEREPAEGGNKNGGEAARERGFGWSKRSVPQSKSGRIIRGRGNFRYRTPSRSRSRSRSNTPEHWKAAQRNVIKMTDFERLGDEKKAREAELNRRAEERKRRHEALTSGDGKKSFFELGIEVPEKPVITIASSLTRPEKSGSVDLNALDYEESDSDKEVRRVEDKSNRNGNSGSKIRNRSRSRSLKKRSRSRSVKRSRSRDRFNNDRRDLRTTMRNRFNDNRRWNNNRFDNNQRWRRSRDRKSCSRSRSRSRHSR
jgi:peptidyl-prolyl isomerase G (cyclophilin G)